MVWLAAIVVLGTRAPANVDSVHPAPGRRSRCAAGSSCSSPARSALNGDGVADALVTVQQDNASSLAVVPGTRKRVTVDPRNPAWRIAIPKGAGLEWYGPVGDVNGDGLADLAVRTENFIVANQPARTYVVLGTRGPLPASLDALGPGGFTING